MAKHDRREEGEVQSAVSGPQSPHTETETESRPLLQALHQLVGNQGVQALEQSGTTDSLSLYLRHLSQVSEGLQVDISAYMPEAAPQSWMREIVPLYDVLAQDRTLLMAQAGTESDVSAHGDSSSGSAQGDASDLSPISRMETGLNVIDEGEDAVVDFEKLMGQAGMGRALTQQEQTFLTQVHGRSFPEIRVHEGGAAKQASRQIQAKAFASGSDIYVSGHLDVSTAEGAELLAHEATHVVQADEGRLPHATGGGLQVSDPSQGHEREAEKIGREAARDVRQGGDGDPWGLERVPIFDSTGQALVDHLGRVLPDPESLDSDHRLILENTLAESREHSEPEGLLGELAGDLVQSGSETGESSHATSAGAGGAGGVALHREAMEEDKDPQTPGEDGSMLSQIQDALHNEQMEKALKRIGEITESSAADQILETCMDEAASLLSMDEMADSARQLVSQGGRLDWALEWMEGAGADSEVFLDVIEMCTNSEHLAELKTSEWMEKLGEMFGDESGQIDRLKDVLGEEVQSLLGAGGLQSMGLDPGALSKGGGLDLGGLTKGGGLDLGGLTKGGGLDLGGLSKGGGLDLGGLTKGGGLDLGGLSKGGGLDLGGLFSAGAPSSSTVASDSDAPSTARPAREGRRERSESETSLGEKSIEPIQEKSAAMDRSSEELSAASAGGPGPHREEKEAGSGSQGSDDAGSILSQIQDALNDEQLDTALQRMSEVTGSRDADQILETCMDAASNLLNTEQMAEAARQLVSQGGRLDWALDWMDGAGADSDVFLDVIEACTNSEHLAELQTVEWQERLTEILGGESEQLERLMGMLGGDVKSLLGSEGLQSMGLELGGLSKGGVDLGSLFSGSSSSSGPSRAASDSRAPSREGASRGGSGKGGESRRGSGKKGADRKKPDRGGGGPGGRRRKP